MNTKKLLIIITIIAAVLYGGLTNVMAGGDQHKAPWKKKGPPPKPAKKPKPPVKPKKPVARPTVYSGRAVGVNISNTVSGAVWLLADTGPLRSCGGLIDLTNGPVNVDNLLSFDSAHVTTSGIGGVASSTAEILNFSATFVEGGITNTIAFASATAEARAECGSNGLTLTASSQVQGLTVDGVPVVATGETNQVVTLSSGSIVLNAQLASTNCQQGEITVAAIFLMLTNGFQGAIGYVEADIRCGSQVPPQTRNCDKVTGGGWISIVADTNIVSTNMVCPTHGSFGVTAGIRRGQFVGKLNYIDHGTGMHVTSTAVTGYTVVDLVTRQIDYDVLIDGVAGTARVTVADNGEPGRNDIFDLSLSTGYNAGGSLRGGNIQLHKCPPGWAK